MLKGPGDGETLEEYLQRCTQRAIRWVEINSPETIDHADYDEFERIKRENDRSPKNIKNRARARKTRLERLREKPNDHQEAD